MDTTEANPTQNMSSVLAEDAPIGVQLWPTTDPKYAPNFTLAEVQIIRNETRTFVRWIYEGDVEPRIFGLNERVTVQFVTQAD